MTQRKGNITVDTADIFPIIKKWLYSEHDIFLRELVANATDAITKRSLIARNKNLEIPTGDICVSVNKDDKTIVISDNGLGMTEEEVEKYIAKLAFSGAQDFVNKMEDAGKEGNDIIGKFGLGFFSAFMVADKVEVTTLSMNDGAQAVKWISTGTTDYTIEDTTKESVGTEITLHINEESSDFLDKFKVSDTLKNHCDFMPYNIGVLDVLEEPKQPLKEDGTEDKDATPMAVTPSIVNETNPIWKQDPKELKDEDYINFYKKRFPMDGEPLFWIHLKVDHPFTLDGVLYFPKLNMNKPFNESNIRLYCKQVFVSDNVKNIIPEFLSLLKGCVDSTDIPLNVSRSSLQGDPNIKRISNYIIKKVAEALKKLYKKDRTRYEEIWNDIGLFIKYGCSSDDKFDELMRERVLFENSQNKFMTLNEYTESIPEDYKEKLKGKVIYFEKEKSDLALRSGLLEKGIQTLTTDDHIDPHFMQHTEMKKIGENEYKFSAIDSEYSNLFAGENSTEEDIKIKDMFNAILFPNKKEEAKDDKAEAASPFGGSDNDIEIIKMNEAGTPAYFKVDEQMKRFAQMSKNMGQNSMFPVKKTLVINPSNPLIKNALNLYEKDEHKALASKLCHHVEDMANIASEGLKNEDKEIFIKRTQELMQELTASMI